MSGGLYSLDKKDFDKTLNLQAIKPYGDTMNDGKVQVSFTLPVPDGDEAVEAAKLLMKKMGLDNPMIVYHHQLTPGFTFFVGYGDCVYTIDYTVIKVPKVEVHRMTMEEIDEFIEKNIGRKLVVVGATTGTDAHTVGLDAILNMKGFAGHYGLERYKMFEVYNMGSQVPNEEFVAKAIEVKADALLVSQTVTQKNCPQQKNLTNLIEILEAEGIKRLKFVVVGGPRITHELAKELGFDAGFGPGTFADDVGAFIAQEWVR
ncbi:MAG: OAM dimerization domain-containing protein, partial [Fervidobacterium sp.]